MVFEQILDQSISPSDSTKSNWNALPFINEKSSSKPIMLVNDSGQTIQKTPKPKKKSQPIKLAEKVEPDTNLVDTVKFDTLILVNSHSNIAATKQPSFFQEHFLKTIDINPQKQNAINPDWFTILIITLIIAFTYLKVSYGKILKQIFRAFLSKNVSNQIVREENVFVQKAMLILHFIFGISGALFLFQLNNYFGWNFLGLRSESIFLLFICFILGLSAIKMMALWILGFTFNNNKLREAYSVNIFLINNVLGLTLIPIVIIIAYTPFNITPAAMFLGIGLIILSFLYRLAKGFSLWRSAGRYSVFYFILYLCTLEIAPLLVLYKAVQ